MPRTPALLAGALLTVALIGGAVGPAQAAPSSAVDSSTTVHLEGDLVVLAGEHTGTAVEVAPTSENEVRLVTDAGVSVELTGSALDGVVTGSTFSGTVSLPTDVIENLDEHLPDSGSTGDVIDGDSALGTTIVEATSELEATLDVVEADVSAPDVDSAVIARAHTVDVVIATLPGAPQTILSDSQVGTLMSDLSTYWSSQTAGQVASVTKPNPVKRIVSAAACDAQTVWKAAAAQFETTVDWYWLNDASDHLLVIAPTSCKAAGLGTVGSLESGGAIWVSHFDVLTRQAVAHEIGHNLGLGHSNTQLCTRAVSEGTGCYISEYADHYDIMGAGLYVQMDYGNVSNLNLMALNVTHKSRLGALSGDDLRSVSRPAGSVLTETKASLWAASHDYGNRGLRVTDPFNGEVYFVEYRGGFGMDSGALYATGWFHEYAPGIRILKAGPGGSSTVLTRPASQPSDRPLFFDVGQTFTSLSGGVRIKVTSASVGASVTVTLGPPAAALTATPVPTISGTPQVGQVLTGSAGTWLPDPVTLEYQWYRSGWPIKDAKAPTYTVTTADVAQTIQLVVTGSKDGYLTSVQVSDPTLKVVPAAAAPPPSNERLSGVDRYSTAVEISKRSFEPGVPVIYVATGLAFPDALAAAPAAAAQSGPLLLTASTSLPASVKAEITRLAPAKIVVVGGTGAVSASVYNQLSTLTPSIRRDAGADRFATSRMIVEKAFPEGSKTAFVATAWGFPDALAASAAAGAIGAPVILVDGKATTVDAKTKTLLSTLGVAKAVVAGGTGVVSTQVEASLKSTLGADNVTRLGGIDRYGTAGVINRASFTQSDTVYLANGLGFADALAGAALAGKNKAPLYTVYANCVPAHVIEDISTLKATRVVLLGGMGALTREVASLTSCS